MTTGQRLQRAITRKFGAKLSQAKVAEQLGVPKGTLSEWLSDTYEPQLGTLRKLAPQLDCSVASLIGDEAA